jgi:hypothetical protein
MRGRVRRSVDLRLDGGVATIDLAREPDDLSWTLTERSAITPGPGCSPGLAPGDGEPCPCCCQARSAVPRITAYATSRSSHVAALGSRSSRSEVLGAQPAPITPEKWSPPGRREMASARGRPMRSPNLYAHDSISWSSEGTGLGWRPVRACSKIARPTPCGSRTSGQPRPGAHDRTMCADPRPRPPSDGAGRHARARHAAKWLIVSAARATTPLIGVACSGSERRRRGQALEATRRSRRGSARGAGAIVSGSGRPRVVEVDRDSTARERANATSISCAS